MVEGFEDLGQLGILEAILIKCKINKSILLPIFSLNPLAQSIDQSGDELVTEHF